MKLDLLMATRNRPEQAMLSLSSILRLAREENVFVLVSDNSDEPSDALKTYCKMHGYNYQKQEHILSMADHWDWLLRQSTGDAIHLMTDRGYLIESEFRQVLEIYRQTHMPIVFGSATFRRRNILGQPLHAISTLRYSGIEERMRFGRLIAVAGKARVSWPLPRLMNGLFPQELIQAVRNRFGSVCGSFMPDVEFGMKSTMLQPDREFIYVDRIGKLSHSGDLSTGASFDVGSDNRAQSDFKRLSGLTKYSQSPLPEDLSIPSGIAHEFNRAAIMSGRAERVSLVALRQEKRARAYRLNKSRGFRRKIRRIETLFRFDSSHQLYIGLGDLLEDFDYRRIYYTGKKDDIEANISGVRGL